MFDVSLLDVHEMLVAYVLESQSLYRLELLIALILTVS